MFVVIVFSRYTPRVCVCFCLGSDINVDAVDLSDPGYEAPSAGMSACVITFPFSQCYAALAVLYAVMAVMVVRKACAFERHEVFQNLDILTKFQHRHATSRAHDIARLACDSFKLAVALFVSRGLWAIVLASVSDPTALHCSPAFSLIDHCRRVRTSRHHSRCNELSFALHHYFGTMLVCRCRAFLCLFCYHLPSPIIGTARLCFELVYISSLAPPEESRLTVYV
jgi:hypothetical protein